MHPHVFHHFKRTYTVAAQRRLFGAVDNIARNCVATLNLRADPIDIAERDSRVVRRQRLRFDTELPQLLHTVEPSFEVRKTIDKYLCSHTVDNPRLLIALKGAVAQNWHTDAAPLFEHVETETPSFFLTLITAIDDVRPEHGPTEFQLPSGTQTPLLKRNESILFDGLLVHRGGAARVDRPPIIYQVFRKAWYRDPNQVD